MYDNRLEIVSPGGMTDGSKIQNMDISKIPSMRRNKTISDIFNRLHYMERRGRGLTRIVESYIDSNYKPQFTSNSLSFSVTFPNKGYQNDSMVMSGQNGNLVNDEDYFMIKLYKTLATKVRWNTIEQI